MASSTVYVTMRFPIQDRKAHAAVSEIVVLAEVLTEDQPWSDEAKRILELGRKLLQRTRIQKHP